MPKIFFLNGVYLYFLFLGVDTYLAKSLSSTNGLSLRFHIMCLWHSLIRKGEAPDKVASHLPDGPGSSHVEDLSEKASPDEMINYKRGRCHDEVTWPHVNCKGMEVTLRSAAT